MKIHQLKIWPEFFAAVLDGSKNFDVRYNDRDYQVGDIVLLQEYDDRKGVRTGRQVCKVITYILAGVPGGIPPLAGLNRNYVVLALADAPEPEAA